MTTHTINYSDSIYDETFVMNERNKIVLMRWGMLLFCVAFWVTVFALIF